MSKMGVSQGGNLLIEANNTPQPEHTAVGSLPQITAAFIVSQTWAKTVNQHSYLMLKEAMVGVTSPCYY